MKKKLVRKVAEKKVLKKFVRKVAEKKNSVKGASEKKFRFATRPPQMINGRPLIL